MFSSPQPCTRSGGGAAGVRIPHRSPLAPAGRRQPDGRNPARQALQLRPIWFNGSVSHIRGSQIDEDKTTATVMMPLNWPGVLIERAVFLSSTHMPRMLDCRVRVHPPGSFLAWKQLQCFPSTTFMAPVPMAMPCLLASRSTSAAKPPDIKRAEDVLTYAFCLQFLIRLCTCVLPNSLMGGAWHGRTRRTESYHKSCANYGTGRQKVQICKRCFYSS